MGNDRSASGNVGVCRIQLPIGQSANGSPIRTFGVSEQLRIVLGLAKLLGAITLVVPGLLRLKEWAYAGFTFAWISAVVAHYLAKDGAVAFFPLILLVLLFVSYFTRAASQRLVDKAAASFKHKPAEMPSGSKVLNDQRTR